MEYENFLIREAQNGADRWCSQCERPAEDCVCEEICDHFRETVGATGVEHVCVPGSAPVPLQTISSDGNDSGKLGVAAKTEGQQKTSAPIGLGAGVGRLQLDYPVWRMTFSEYGNAMGWEVPS